MPERVFTHGTEKIHRLVRELDEAGADLLERYVREVVVPMILAEIPIGDPRLDPNPSISLRDALKVRRVGNTVYIEMDTEYAAVQHFADYQHPRGGKSHFIDHPLQVAAGQIEQYIGQGLQRQLRDARGRFMKTPGFTQTQARGPSGRFI